VIRVGLIISPPGLHQGGLNYFHNLLSCYQQHPNRGLKLALFTDHEEKFASYRSDAIEIHSCPQASLLSLHSLGNWPRRLLNELAGYDPVLLRIMERHRIDLLTHRSIGRQTSINTLNWQGDFQHRIFPEFFSARECAKRDSSIANVRLWRNILLSSHAANKDFRRFYPELDSVKAHILHFSSTAVLRVVPVAREELAAHYPVREPYFFLPTQFWQHKNHAVVVEALRQTSTAIRVICTGAMQDPRDPSYVPELLTKIKHAGLEQRFIRLGTVPYPMLVSLMHHSVAVLQPSLFEGWSTSVEESKTMCKQIILSSIDVHLEQAPKRGTFFSPDSPEELAACMSRVDGAFCAETEQGFVNQRPLHKTRIEREWIEEFARILKAVAAPPGSGIHPFGPSSNAGPRALREVSSVGDGVAGLS
jgi:glycosyltransferase involved in cell wall biosynthesis